MSCEDKEKNKTNKPKDKKKVVDMMEYISNKSEAHTYKDLYTREDIEKMLSTLDITDTYNEDMATDFIDLVIEFFVLGKKMGMSSFIARAALIEFVETACAIVDSYSCSGDCETCEHKEEPEF